MSTTAKNMQPTTTIGQAESCYGNAEPQLAIRFPRGTQHRILKAALHKLAADVELATPASERWCVNTEDFNESGRVYLELADAMPAEAARGIAVLRKLVGIISWQALATSAPQQYILTHVIRILHPPALAPAAVPASARFIVIDPRGRCLPSPSPGQFWIVDRREIRGAARLLR